MQSMTQQQIEVVERFGLDETDAWYDWHWQVRHTVRTIDDFSELLGIDFTEEQRTALYETVARFPLAVTPYYLSLIDPTEHETDPIYLQCFPSPRELDVFDCDIADPLAEDKDSPAPGITHRYPDRVLFHVSNTCALYCRHCTRKRKVGDLDLIPNDEAIEAGVAYIRENPVIRDVLISGGDPLMLPDERIEWILEQVTRIPHVEVVRIGTRVPVVLPYRITERLTSMLQRFQPLWINTHFNHPRELTASSKKALARLANAGIPLGNQSVLLSGVNDCPRIMKSLVQKLVQNRVRPYYIYQCDLAEGLNHFRTPVGKGIEIMENLVGHTSGFARPTYVIDAPGGGGKIPVMPNYIVSWSTNKVILRNFEGVICTYKEPDTYEQWFCDRKCKDCKLQLKLDESTEARAVGISRLLADSQSTTTLTPKGTARLQRRSCEASRGE